MDDTTTNQDGAVPDAAVPAEAVPGAPAEETDRYNGLDLHRKLLQAAGYEPFTPGLFTKMARELGLQPSGYNRAIHTGKALLHRVGRWCDKFGLRFVWNDGGVDFVLPCEAFVFNAEGAVPLAEDDIVVVFGDGKKLSITDTAARQYLHALANPS